MISKLDRDYFNSIELPPIEDKYYDKDKVDDLLVDIRAKALEMNALNRVLLDEILDLRSRLSEKEKPSAVRYSAISPKTSDDERIESTMRMCNQMIDNAKREAKTIVDQSRAEAARIRNTTANANENSSFEDFVMNMADAFETIKLRNLEDAEYINSQWQKFLASINSERAPEDMGQRVKNIADAVKEISLEED